MGATITLPGNGKYYTITLRLFHPVYPFYFTIRYNKAMKRFSGIFMHWLPLAAAVTGVCLLVYGAVQQNYRQGLNDPQIQMVEDTVRALKDGASVTDFFEANVPFFDASKSLQSFLAIYDATGRPIESTAKIGTQMPRPPRDVFTYAETRGEDRVTWQPDGTTRIALVIQAVGSSPEMYVAAGRNMREVEAREVKMSFFVLLAWITLIVVTLTLEIVGDTMRKKIVAG